MHSKFFQRKRTVCFTGHRPNHWGTYDENCERIVTIKEKLHKFIDLSYRDGYRTFITGMALGVDQWAAEHVLTIRDVMQEDVVLAAALPCQGQEKMWPSSARKRYRNILNRCDFVHRVSDGEYVRGCMNERNRWMVDQSGLVIAVWSGKKSGGTFNCVNYARQQNVPVRNVLSEQETLAEFGD